MTELDIYKYALAIHTSSPELGLALNNFAGDKRFYTWNLGRDLSNLLHQYLAEFMPPQTWQDLEFIAVAIGPGSFTGTRIGVVTARTLAQQLNIPLFGISTLAAVAWDRKKNLEVYPIISPSSLGEISEYQETAIAIQMPAQRGQLFAAIYQELPNNLGLKTLFTDTAIAPELWQETLNNCQTPYRLIDIPAGAGFGASVSSLLELANLDWQQGKRSHWSEALPYYGQHPVEYR